MKRKSLTVARLPWDSGVNVRWKTVFVWRKFLIRNVSPTLRETKQRNCIITAAFVPRMYRVNRGGCRQGARGGRDRGRATTRRVDIYILSVFHYPVQSVESIHDRVGFLPAVNLPLLYPVLSRACEPGSFLCHRFGVPMNHLSICSRCTSFKLLPCN